MIRYSLICEHEHEFEGWFSSSAGFDEQQAAHAVECPMCGSTSVKKALMAPSVPARRQNQLSAPAEATGIAEKRTVATAEALTDAQRKIAELARQMRENVIENAENVGESFAEEARKIHYEETDRRNIYGKATPDEVAGLIEDEIEIIPLPELPEDKN